MSHAEVPGLDGFLEFVEWTLVRETIAARTSSSPGSFRARELRPTTDPAEVERLQARTADAMALVAADRVPDLEQVADVAELYRNLARAQRSLGARELRWIALTVQAGLAAREAFQDRPALAALVPGDGEDEADAALAKDVLAAIGPYNVVLDEASETLAGVRAELLGVRERLRQALAKLGRDSRLMLVVAEPALGEHEGVPCLRVRAAQVRRLAGVVRGSARDGALLVEPDEAQELYSEVRRLEAEELLEARRIVTGLAQRALPRREAHERLAEGLIVADLHIALARHARDLQLSPPALSRDLAVELRDARHPLLPRAECVPIDVALDGARRMLVISGPNGGGKTAAMKTLGLAVALAQSGAWAPAAVGRLPVVTRFVAVAAPRSSVCAGLSQFQAHARDLAAALEAVRPGALVLLDEIGQGTDPLEAAALAQAVLEHLLAQQVLTLATTHLMQLKGFATRTSGVANASVDLDAHGKPTFVLTLGRSGRSFALEVARSAGLPSAICDRAERLNQDGGAA